MKKKKNTFSWNYRIFKYPDGTLGVHEAYYDEGSNQPTTWSLSPAVCGAETIEDLIENIELIKSDILKSKEDIIKWDNKEPKKLT